MEACVLHAAQPKKFRFRESRRGRLANDPSLVFFLSIRLRFRFRFRFRFSLDLDLDLDLDLKIANKSKSKQHKCPRLRTRNCVVACTQAPPIARIPKLCRSELLLEVCCFELVALLCFALLSRCACLLARLLAVCALLSRLRSQARNRLRRQDPRQPGEDWRCDAKRQNEHEP